MKGKVKNIEEIKKQKIKKFKDSGKRCLIRCIENGFIVSTGNTATLGLFNYEEDNEDDFKKCVEEFYFKTLEEALNFTQDYFEPSL